MIKSRILVVTAHHRPFTVTHSEGPALLSSHESIDTRLDLRTICLNGKYTDERDCMIKRHQIVIISSPFRDIVGHFRTVIIRFD